MWWTLLLMLAQVPPSTMLTIVQGRNSAVTERREVVARNAAELEVLWNAHDPAQPPPQVDFSKELVLAVFLGRRSSGGYGVEIQRTRQEADALVVEYTEREPGRDAIVTQVVTTPFHIVRMPRNDKSIRFEKVTPGAAR